MTKRIQLSRTRGLYPPAQTCEGARFYAVNRNSGYLFVLQWRRRLIAADELAWRTDTGIEFHPTSEFAHGFDLGPRIPGPEHLLRHEQRVQELLNANNWLVDENRRLRAAIAKAQELTSSLAPKTPTTDGA